MKIHKGLTPGTTYEENVNDNVYKIPHSKLELNDMRAAYAKVTVESNGASYAFGTDPVQSGVGHPVSAGDTIDLHSYKEIQDFRILNETGGSAIDLTITIFYK